jgi:hypothetical protein
MATGDSRITGCNGFPPFIRVTGTYVQAGRFGGFWGTNGVKRDVASINGAPGAIRREVDGLTEVGTFSTPTAFVSGYIFNEAQIYTDVAGAAWVSEQFSPRNLGWVGQWNQAIEGLVPIYTHVVGQYIKRRHRLGDSYWQCIKNTNKATLVSGVYIVGNRGEDPQSLPDYWTSVAHVADNLLANIYYADDFMQPPTNTDYGDFKLSIPPAGGVPALTGGGIWTGSRETPWVDVPPYPYSEPLRSLISASYDQFRATASRWSQPDDFVPSDFLINNYSVTWRTQSSAPTTLKKGELVRLRTPGNSTRGIFRIKEDIAYPGSANVDPRTDTRFEQLPSYSDPRAYQADYNYPTAQPSGGTVQVIQDPAIYPPAVTGRKFSKRQRYGSFRATSDFVSFMGPTGTSSKGTGITQKIWLNCNTDNLLSLENPLPVPRATADHPLSDPTDYTATPWIKSGEVGRCHVFRACGGLTSQHGFPYQVRCVWESTIPEFIFPGQYIQVRYSTTFPFGGGTDRDDLVIKLHAIKPQWYPNPSFAWWYNALSESVGNGSPYYNFGSNNSLGFGGVVGTGYWLPECVSYDVGVVSPKPYFRLDDFSTPRHDDIAFDTFDSRNLSEIEQCIYPANPLSNTAGVVVGNQIGFKSSEATQEYLYSVNLSWARLRVRGASDPTLVAFDGTINPMILLRQRLTLSNRGTCA